METFLSVNNTFFTIIGYPMSYIEFFGTILNIWCVWLVSKNKILNWPIGILATILFGILFLEINLYADFFEQIYFLITGFWGWWVWSQTTKDSPDQKPIERLAVAKYSWWFISILIGTILLGYITSNLNIYFPAVFPDPASYPYLDSFTTVMSFAATILLVRKKVEAWYLWIVVDIIGVGLYWAKDVRLISLLYVVFLILAIKGLINWSKIYKEKIKQND